jgi:hypothetical protein
MQKDHVDFFSYLIEPGYDLNDGMEDNDPLEYRVEERDGYKGIRCGSMDRFITLLTIALEELTSSFASKYDASKLEDFPTIQGWDYIVDDDGGVFFYDERYRANEVVIGRVSALAVYDS